MAENFQDLRRDISTFLMAMRYAVDRPYRPVSRRGTEDREQFMRSMLLVEEARVRFNSYVRFREEPTPEEWIEVRDGLFKFVNGFLHSPDVDPAVFDRPFRVPVPSAQRDNLSPFLMLLTQGATVGDALVAFRNVLQQSTVTTTLQTSLDFGDLTTIVPRQQVAPARFDVVDGRIVLADLIPKTLEEDRGNISAALDHIKGSGESLIRSLEQSNCDRRLLDSVRELHTQIEANGNAVKIGLTNLACGVMSAQFQQELPDALNAMFNSYSASVSMYVAQFPEWEQFTQRAASIDLDEEEIAEIDVAASEVIRALESQPELADPEVPKTIKLVREFMSRPGNSAKRAAFAMMRTIENLVSSIVRHSVAALERTAEKTVDGLSTAASKIIVGLLSIALVGATGIGSAAVHAGAPWVKQAAEVVQRQISQLGG